MSSSLSIRIKNNRGVSITLGIGAKRIGSGEPVYIIAEMAWSHDGELGKARKIVQGAAGARADAICLHMTSMEDYMVPDYRVPGSGASAAVGGKQLYDFLHGKNLRESDWKTILAEAKAAFLHALVMPNDEPSFESAQKLGADAYVLAPATMGEIGLVKKIAESGKPMFIRTGGAAQDEITRTLRIAKDAGNANIALIHGFQGFPTPLEEMNLSMMETLREKFGVPVGFADHTDGGSEMALVIPLVAVGAGADVIEKHVTHDRSLRGLDFESALNPEDFARMVAGIRDVEKAMGSGEWKDLSEKEKRYRAVVRKHVVAAKPIAAGEKISSQNITFKRANGGLYAEEADPIIGKKAKRAIRKDEGIDKDMAG